MTWKKGVYNPSAFVKGDPRINRKGRPKTHDALRKMIQEVLNEEVEVVVPSANAREAKKGKTKTVLMTRLEQMIQNMVFSTAAGDHDNLLKHGFGEPPKEVQHGGAVTLTVRYDEEAPPTDKKALADELTGSEDDNG